MGPPKRLFEPASVYELLLGWLIHAHKGRDRHDLAARTYEKGRYSLGIPTLVVSTIVGTSVFANLSSATATRVSLWVGVLSVLAAVLAALQTFLDYPTRAERHRAAGVKYKACIRLIEQYLANLAAGSPPSSDEVAALRVQLDALEEQAPVLMSRLYATVEQQYANVAYVKEALELYR